MKSSISHIVPAMKFSRSCGAVSLQSDLQDKVFSMRVGGRGAPTSAIEARSKVAQSASRKQKMGLLAESFVSIDKAIDRKSQSSCWGYSFSGFTHCDVFLQELTPERRKAQETYIDKLATSKFWSVREDIQKELSQIKADLEAGNIFRETSSVKHDKGDRPDQPSPKLWSTRGSMNWVNKLVLCKSNKTSQPTSGCGTSEDNTQPSRTQLFQRLFCNQKFEANLPRAGCVFHLNSF